MFDETKLKVALFDGYLTEIQLINRYYGDFKIKDEKLYYKEKYILSICLMDTINHDVVMSILMAVINALGI